MPRTLTATHNATLIALAEAMFSGVAHAPRPDIIADRVDAFLARITSPLRKDLDRALWVIEWVVPGFCLRIGRFSHLSLDARIHCLDQLGTTSIAPMRDVARVIRILTLFPVYTDENVRRSIGYVDVEMRPRFATIDTTPAKYPLPADHDA